MVEEVIESVSAERDPIHQEIEEPGRGHMIQDLHIAPEAEDAQVVEEDHTLLEIDIQTEVEDPARTAEGPKIAEDPKTAEDPRIAEDQRTVEEKEGEEVLQEIQEKTERLTVETLDIAKGAMAKALNLKTLEESTDTIVTMDQIVSTQTEATLNQDLHLTKKRS